MIREIKDTHSYARVITLLSVLSIVFGLATSILGELMLPLASGFLAALFLFEKPKGRVLSYVCPVASLVLAVLLKGIAAITVVECILLAVIIAVCYRKSLSKAETSIYLTLTVAVFVLISLYLSAAASIDNFSFNAVKGYYTEIFMDYKREFTELLSTLTVTNADGVAENIMSVEEASLYFTALANSFVALIAVFAFLISGLTLKLYATLVLRNSKHGILKTFAHFLPSNFCAYVYIASTIAAFLFSDTSAVGLILTNANAILMAVFAYMGLRYLLILAKASQRRLLIYMIILFGFISFSTIAPSIISFLGVWVVIGTNLNNRIQND